MQTDDIEKATQILESAAAAINERGSQHGDTHDSFQMIADLWTVFLRNKHLKTYRIILDLHLVPSDIAMLMTFVKQVRAVYGDPTNDDNFIDAAGYTAIARMLSSGGGNEVLSSSLQPVTIGERRILEDRARELDMRESALNTRELEIRRGLKAMQSMHDPHNEMERQPPLHRAPPPELPSAPLPPEDEITDLLTRLSNIQTNVPSFGSE